MSGDVLGVAWYRFRATFGRRGGSYLTLVLLIGLVGGIGMGAIAGARRTQSSFSTFLASTNPPDLTVTIYGANANNAASSQGDGSGFFSPGRSMPSRTRPFPWDR